jgi:cytochrome oxidase Cu insertion factor (SCO1/SenC/PrrC family)
MPSVCRHASGRGGRPPPALGFTKEASMALEVGRKAPDFTLPDQDGRSVRLSSFKGKRVIVFFYPKASTPG